MDSVTVSTQIQKNTAEYRKAEMIRQRLIRFTKNAISMSMPEFVICDEVTESPHFLISPPHKTLI